MKDCEGGYGEAQKHEGCKKDHVMRPLMTCLAMKFFCPVIGDVSATPELLTPENGSKPGEAA